MKKKKIAQVLAALLATGAVVSLASCKPNDNVNPEPTPEVLKYTVTYNANGHGTAPAEAKDLTNLPSTLPTLTDNDYDFGGWYKDAACTQPVTAGEALTANITLYAKWTAKAKPSTKYNITYNTNSHGDAVASLESTTIPQELPELTADGYNFWGWYLDAEFTKAAVEGSAITGDTTLYAKWTAAQQNNIEMNGTAYDTIAKALAAIPTTGDTSTYTIRLNKGTYQENGLSYNGSATIHIIGNTRTKYGADVIIQGRGSDMSKMRGRELIEIQGTGSIILENVSLVSDYSRTETTKDVQAEVLATDTKGNTVAYNCSFKSHQDTLRTAGKAWFYGCYVEGDTDFIWMEAAGSVALYEKCEIVSVYDENAKTHSSYVTAPRMAVSSKVGKGLVFYNSVVRESDEAKEKGQATYLARSPWTSGYYNQVAYINTECSDIEIEENKDSKSKNAPWYGNMITTDYAQTIIGWKMDTATALSLGISGKDYIIDDAVTAKEFNGRKSILNRIYNTGKQKYEKDAANNWDIDAVISEYGLKVVADASSDVLEGETNAEPTIYTFDGNTDLSSLCNGFALENGKPHYRGNNGATITIPVNGKCFVEVYGYYCGTVETKADTQGMSVMFFNNYSTGSEVEQDYIVYDANAKEVVITAKATSYITRIVVSPDNSIEEATPVTNIDITSSTKVETVGVALTLSASVNKDATNKSVIWSSSDSSIGEIDPYTGKVTFKKAGEVTFTASACDGSGITKDYKCNPKEANWTASEWYTTDTTVDTEEGADGIGNFGTNSSANKSIKANYNFKNLAGTEITTSYGLKLNSSGKLSIATTKKAVLTVITCDAGKIFATPIVSDGTTTVTPTSTTKSEDNKTITYVYEIPSAGMWDIERGDTAQENNPILYAKCEYKEAIISTSTGITFKGSHYTEAKTNISDIFTPAEAIDATGTTVEINDMKLTNCKSNGGVTNWLTFKSSSSAKIEFKVDKACTVLVGYYSKLQTVKFDGEVVQGNKTSVSNGAGDIVEYEITGAGVVTIEASQDDYLGFVGVLFKTLEMKKADACAKLDQEYPASNYTKNSDYETVLAAQKDTINAATDDETLASAVAAAKTAMDALTVDPEETPDEYVSSLNYNFANLENKPADGEAVVSTKEIEFVNCVAHGGQYVALKTNNAVKIKLAKGAVLTVNMPYSNGVQLNGVDVTLDSNNNLVYTAIEAGEVVITGTAGNAYITTIKVVSPVSSLNYNFANLENKPADGEAVVSTKEIEFVNCVAHGGQYVALKTNNAVKIYLAKGAVLTVNMPYSKGVQLNGVDVTLDSNNNLVYTAIEAGEVVITGTAGSAYITTITVTSE